MEAMHAATLLSVPGFDFTSNVLAGKLYGIPVRGTLAHSYVSSFTSLAEVNPRVSIGGKVVESLVLGTIFISLVLMSLLKRVAY